MQKNKFDHILKVNILAGVLVRHTATLECVSTTKPQNFPYPPPSSDFQYLNGNTVSTKLYPLKIELFTTNKHTNVLSPQWSVHGKPNRTHHGDGGA